MQSAPSAKGSGSPSRAITDQQDKKSQTMVAGLKAVKLENVTDKQGFPCHDVYQSSTRRRDARNALRHEPIESTNCTSRVCFTSPTRSRTQGWRGVNNDGTQGPTRLTQNRREPYAQRRKVRPTRPPPPPPPPPNSHPPPPPPPPPPPKTDAPSPATSSQGEAAGRKRHRCKRHENVIPCPPLNPK